MTDDSGSEEVDLTNLQGDFLSLRVGESIPQLEIASIRKISCSGKPDNLHGVDYKYVIETTDHKLLKVNSWTLWRQIVACLRKAGKVNVTLSLAHTGVSEYAVELI